MRHPTPRVKDGTSRFDYQSRRTAIPGDTEDGTVNMKQRHEQAEERGSSKTHPPTQLAALEGTSDARRDAAILHGGTRSLSNIPTYESSRWTRRFSRAREIPCLPARRSTRVGGDTHPPGERRGCGATGGGISRETPAYVRAANSTFAGGHRLVVFRQRQTSRAVLRANPRSRTHHHPHLPPSSMCERECVICV